MVTVQTVQICTADTVYVVAYVLKYKHLKHDCSWSTNKSSK